MTDDDRMAMIETKEEDVYESRKPEGIKKEEEVEENFIVDLTDNSIFSLRKTSGFALQKLTENY
jgi:hypothetical protein